MEIPKYPRYELVTFLAMYVTTHLNIQEYPINLKKIIKSEKIKLKKYTTLIKKSDNTIKDISDILGSEYGLLIRDVDGKYILNYNDTQPEHTINFTLAHELGHYCLRHLEDFSATELGYRGIPSKEYQVLEREANCFARNLLSPAPIACLFSERNHKDIMDFFGIGYKASKVRIDFIDKDYKNIQPFIKDNIEKYLDNLCFKISNTYHCENCGGINIQENPNFCSVCNHNNLIHITPDGYQLHKDFGGPIMKYSSYELNEESIAYECPHCENEELIENATICHVCGTHIQNICLGDISLFANDNMHSKDLIVHGCGTTLAGNARYCHKCAGISSYNFQNLLKNWENDKYNCQNQI